MERITAPDTALAIAIVLVEIPLLLFCGVFGTALDVDEVVVVDELGWVGAEFEVEAELELVEELLVVEVVLLVVEVMLVLVVVVLVLSPLDILIWN